ncbi:MAG: LapA family protein [Clostridia bacterium]|nr:LapA family protein [Clostridia bacterium]
MQVTLIISLIFAIFIALFAAMNGGEVTINLFFWKLENVSQAMVILGSAAVGAILVYLSGTMHRLKSGKRVRDLEKKVTSLEKELANATKVEPIPVETAKKDVIPSAEENNAEA